jgi:hypothetical protein
MIDRTNQNLPLGWGALSVLPDPRRRSKGPVMVVLGAVLLIAIGLAIRWSL